MYTGLALFLLVVMLISVGANFTLMARSGINVNAFMAQIQKLIMANNIDRAIKLCNAETNSTFSQSAKMLLTRANRVHTLELTYQEALLHVTRGSGSFHQIRLIVGVIELAIFGAFCGAIYAGGAGSIPIQICLAVSFLCLVLNLLVSANRSTQNDDAASALLKLRNLLYYRSEYTPPMYRPVRSTPEELVEQRKAMDAFNSEVESSRGRGEEVNTNEEFARRSDPATGLLPPV